MQKSSEHLSIEIDRPSAEIYSFVVNPEHLHLWAAGLAGNPVKNINGSWIADSPMGTVTVTFAPENRYGVLDHEVQLPDGTIALNPVRVIPLTALRSELIFTARRRDASDEAFAADKALIEADLRTLKALLEQDNSLPPESSVG